MKDLKIVFMGTPDFSAEVLSNLAAEHNVVAAVTGPDKPVGRGYALRPSPLKVRAAELGIPVLQYGVRADSLRKIPFPVSSRRAQRARFSFAQIPGSVAHTVGIAQRRP